MKIRGHLRKPTSLYFPTIFTLLLSTLPQSAHARGPAPGNDPIAIIVLIAIIGFAIFWAFTAFLKAESKRDAVKKVANHNATKGIALYIIIVIAIAFFSVVLATINKVLAIVFGIIVIVVLFCSLNKQSNS